MGIMSTNKVTSEQGLKRWGKLNTPRDRKSLGPGRKIQCNRNKGNPRTKGEGYSKMKSAQQA